MTAANGRRQRALLALATAGCFAAAFGGTYLATRPAEPPAPVAPLEPTASAEPDETLGSLLSQDATPLTDEQIQELIESQRRPLDEWVAAFEQDPSASDAVIGIMEHVYEMPAEAAEPLLKRLLKTAPGERAFIEYLGWTVYFEAERYQDAIAFFKPFFELQGGKGPAVAEIIAQSYLALDDPGSGVVYARAAAAAGDDPALELQLGHFEIDLNRREAAEAAFARGQAKLAAIQQRRATQPAGPALGPEDVQYISIEVSLGIGEAKLQKDAGKKEAAAATLAGLEERLRSLRVQVAALDDPVSSAKETLEQMIDRQETAVHRARVRLEL